MNLDQELKKARKEIKTDSYPVTIRELASLYREGELDIHPEFQRFLRWTKDQKTKLIESLLLGIPIPSVFLYQRKDGVLDVVDGLQRISTILEFMGELKDEQGSLLPHLILGGAQYLPSLEGKAWHPIGGVAGVGDDVQRFFRQEKLDVKLLLRDSDDQAKYELFQRINTGGTPLSDQEVRNCILIMVNRQAYFWLEGLSREADFSVCAPLQERLLLERYDLELVLRYVVLNDIPLSEVLDIGDFGQFLTTTMTAMFESGTVDFNSTEDRFKRTFRALNAACGESSLKKFNASASKFSGTFLISAFEMVALGVSANIAYVEQQGPSWLASKVQGIWSDPRSDGIYGMGVSTARRLPRTLKLGREYFGEP